SVFRFEDSYIRARLSISAAPDIEARGCGELMIIGSRRASLPTPHIQWRIATDWSDVRSARWLLRQDNWIVAASGERMAAQQSPHCLHSAANRAIAFDRFHRVLGAGRNEAAGVGEHRRE